MGTTAAQTQQTLQTPLEKIGFSRVSLSEEISAYLQTVARFDPNTNVEILGKSVQGRPIEALVFSAASVDTGSRVRPRVMIIGSQHGAAEPAGGEAMLVLARELVSGELRALRDTLDIILIPNANPDGRDLLRRSNANMININTDFVVVSQPETQALKEALRRFQPDVLLDSHESAILKRQTLAKQGYLTDFHAQFESANNPAVPASARAFAFDVMMPAMIDKATKKGLPAHRYIGEITSIHQPITYGGLTLQNFRNTAGISGALSFLVETKLDSREDKFPTYRNIAVRIERQLICLHAFLAAVNEQSDSVLREVKQMRAAMPVEPLTLKSRYVKDSAHPDVAIALRRLDSRQLETRIFANHRRVETHDVVALPAYVAISAHADIFKPLLDKHHVAYQHVQNAFDAQALVQRFGGAMQSKEGAELLSERQAAITLNAGTLLIDTKQPLGRMVLLLLDPRSTSNVFRFSPYSELLARDQDFFIYPLLQVLAPK